MDVRIVDFPETRIAALEHRGPPQLEHESVRRLIAWRQANRLQADRHRSYGIHYSDPRTAAPVDHRVDFAISVDGDIAANPYGVVNKRIPAGRCAVARHLGQREDIIVAYLLYGRWLPSSGETLRDFPIFFHYLNAGPQVREREMITDIYLPVR